MIRTRRSRDGFTLVELMVTSAMTVLLMWLISWLLGQMLDHVRQVKADVDLTSQERLAVTVLKYELQSQMFLEEDGRGVRLSDQRTDLARTGGYTPPRGGFVFARSRPFGTQALPNPANVWEAGDDGFDSSRSTDHVLHFTVLLKGGSHSDQFGIEAPAGSGQQWFSTTAEVCYYLYPNGRQTANGLPLFDLYRHGRIAARTPDFVSAYRTPASYPDAPEVMAVSAQQIRTLSELTIPFGFSSPGPPALGSVRLPQPYTPLGVSTPSARRSQDLLISNVLSFEVKFTGPQVNLGPGAWPSDPPSTLWPRPMTPTAAGALANTDYPYDNLPFDGQFDTHSLLVPSWRTDVASASRPNAPVKPFRITSVQVRLRVWDSNTKSTRQTTLVQDL